jgi:cyclopropane-fatty-acyl-phospholipid synthase
MNSMLPQKNTHSAAREAGWLARFSPRLSSKWSTHFIDKIDDAMLCGTVEATLPDGHFRILGGRGDGPTARVTVHNWRALIRIGLFGATGWYTAWDKGEWSSPDPVAFFEIVSRNRSTIGGIIRATGVMRVAQRVAHFAHRNSRAGAKRNIIAHYDLGNSFYAAWLDQNMNYSSAMFARPIRADEPLETAQDRKNDALMGRLALPAGGKLLEIGCGWGHLSKTCALAGHEVTAITLSPSQLDYATRQCVSLSNPPQFQICDYRDVKGTFDGVVSVEMVEAVGENYWPDYLDSIAARLKPGGRAVIQYIAAADDVFEAYAANADFIQTHVFPGGMLLSERRFMALAQARGFAWEDPVHFPDDYAETLRRWRVGFDSAVAEGRLPDQFDAHFIRLWRYYLMYCEGGFRGGSITVAQVTLVKGT